MILQRGEAIVRLDERIGPRAEPIGDRVAPMRRRDEGSLHDV
jgi:hypothetical protein